MATLIVMSFPTAFFTSAAYSEPLFLFLMMGFVYHALIARSKACLFYLALLPLTRGSAAFVFGGYALYVALSWLRHRQALVNHPPSGHSPSSGQRAARGEHGRSLLGDVPATEDFPWRFHLLCCFAFLFGVVAYLSFFFLATGNPFSGITAQARVQSGISMSYLFNPRAFLGNFSGLQEFWFLPIYGLFDQIILFCSLAAIVIFLGCKQWTLLCFYLPNIYCHAAMSDGLVGFARYALTAMPFLALVLARHTRHAWQAGLVYGFCAFSFLVQLYLAARFAANTWVD